MPPDPRAPLTVAILAGGASRRMGRDKAALVLEGRTLLRRTIDTALTVSHRVVVVGRIEDELAESPVAAGLRDGIGAQFLTYDAPRQGPLGGLVTALRHAQGPVLLLACDMPLLKPDALKWLIVEAGPLLPKPVGAVPDGEATRLHGAVARWQGQLEPLFAIYTPACLTLAESRLAAGERAMHRFVEAGAFRVVDVPDWVGAQLANMNTPAEWEKFDDHRLWTR